jgi:hypothetical protein
MAYHRVNFTLGLDVEDLPNSRLLNIRAVRFLETWAAHCAVTKSRNGILGYTAVENLKLTQRTIYLVTEEALQ